MKEVLPLRQVLGPRRGLVVRVYYKLSVELCPTSKKAVTVDCYAHGKTSGTFEGERPVLIPCDPIDARAMADYYLPRSAVRFTDEPQGGQIVRRVLPRLPRANTPPPLLFRLQQTRRGSFGPSLSEKQRVVAHQVAEMYKGGKSMNEIRTALKIGRTTAYRYLDFMNVKPDWGWRGSDKNRAQNLRSER